MPGISTGPGVRFQRLMTLPIAIAALFLATPAAAAAQATSVVLSGDGSCRACRIEIDRMLTLGATDGPGALVDENSWLARDARGRWYAFSYRMEGIAVYDSTDRYIKQIGRKGLGPGEYQAPSSVVSLPRGQVAITDGDLPRITVLDSGYSVVRTIPISTRAGRATALDGGRAILFNAPDARRGEPLYIVDATSGKLIATFGAPSNASTRVPEGTLRHLTVDPRRGTIWSAFASRYLLEEYGRDGKRIGTIERRAGWFVEPPRVGPGEDRAPVPVVYGISADSLGRLWVLSRVGDPRWRTAIERKPQMNTYSVTDEIRYQDIIIDVLDPRSRQVLASTRIDYTLSAFIGDGLAIVRRLDSEDRPVIDR